LKMDLDTFLTTLYVLVDDWYSHEGAGWMERPKAGEMKMSDSEVLTVALAGQWRVGVPWQSERGVVRYLQAHGRCWFPQMLKKSAFNERVRKLWGALVQLQQAAAEWLGRSSSAYECVDSLPLPAFSRGQAQREAGHWLWSSRLGRGQYGEWFWGDRLLTSVSQQGAVTGWVVGGANINDRWLMQMLLSARAGQPELVTPPRRRRDGQAHDEAPISPLAPVQAVGRPAPCPYLADANFNGDRWLAQWRERYQAEVVTPPGYPEARRWSAVTYRWFAHHRQVIETTFATLDAVFQIKRLQAHSRWGQYTRIAAKLAAYNLGLLLNRSLGRSPFALATLIV
jgi:hypothetical protein